MVSAWEEAGVVVGGGLLLRLNLLLSLRLLLILRWWLLSLGRHARVRPRQSEAAVGLLRVLSFENRWSDRVSVRDWIDRVD